MNAQMTDRLFGDAFVMMNFEITFHGVKSWFDMAGYNYDDAMLFRLLLFPESFSEELQAGILRMIVYRCEDIFFQTNRSGTSPEADSQYDSNEATHQLLLKMMSLRTLQGTDNALLDLYVLIQEDMQRDAPLYATLHSLFQQKWDDSFTT